jgi:hypothetical protein
LLHLLTAANGPSRQAAFFGPAVANGALRTWLDLKPSPQVRKKPDFSWIATEQLLAGYYNETEARIAVLRNVDRPPGPCQVRVAQRQGDTGRVVNRSPYPHHRFDGLGEFRHCRKARYPPSPSGPLRALSMARGPKSAVER